MRPEAEKRGWLAALGASGVLVLAVVAGGAALGGAVLFSDFPVDLSEPGEEEVQVRTGGGELGGLLGLGGAGAAAAGGALGATVGAAAVATLDSAADDAGGGAAGGAPTGTADGGAAIPTSGPTGETGGGGSGQGGGPGADGGEAPGGGAGSPPPPPDEDDGVLDDTLNHLGNTVEALVAGDLDSTLGGVPRTVGDGLVKDVGDLVGQRSLQHGNR